MTILTKVPIPKKWIRILIRNSPLVSLKLLVFVLFAVFSEFLSVVDAILDNVVDVALSGVVDDVLLAFVDVDIAPLLLPTVLARTVDGE